MTKVELIPNISVGTIKFGSHIEGYLEQEHVFYKKDEDDEYMEDFYDFEESAITVFVNDKNIITSINCKVDCFWKGENLIGLSIKDFIELSGIEPDEHQQIYVLITEDEGEEQDVYDFESLGLQLWVWKNEIVTVGCTNYNLIE